MKPPLLTCQQVASALSVTTRTVRQWANDGIEYTRLPGGHRRFRVEAVEKLAGRKIQIPKRTRKLKPKEAQGFNGLPPEFFEQFKGVGQLPK